MSSISATNLDKSLELIQKTYNPQSKPTNHIENVSQSRSSIAKILSHHPSRKNSVHDIHQLTKDDLNKILIDIQETLSRFKVLLETIDSIETIREDFFKLKDYLFKKIIDFISKLSHQSGRRGSIISKGNVLNDINLYVQHLIYCIEYFRNELFKSLYLFSSLIYLSSFDLSNFNNINSQPFFNSSLDQISSDDQNIEHIQDINQIKKDINSLEEHIYVLNQSYYSQIPDGNTLGQFRETTTNIDRLNLHRGRFHSKFSRRSSTGSNENANIFIRFSQKCRFLCCICQQNYI